MKKKTKKQPKNNLTRHQAGALLILCGALAYYIVAQGLMVQTEYYPTTIFAPVAMNMEDPQQQPAGEYPTEFGEIALGSQLNESKRINETRTSFSSNTETIFLSAELIYPSKGIQIQGLFYYFGQGDVEPVLLSSSSVELADQSQDVVFFSLPRPGSTWQLKGKFKALLMIPSSDLKHEIDFTIY